MRSYEITFLFREGENFSDLKDRVKSYITKFGNKFVSDSELGLRDLAYPIHKNRETFHKAFYYFVKAEMKPEVISEMEKSFKFDESIIRYMILVE
ncbi:MAG: 30S ribosomal protein S6 [Brevinematales bacterium]|nr:30S ribosomal protein S6 [Brevinematales bacterium]